MTFRSGEHVSTFSENFELTLNDDEQEGVNIVRGDKDGHYAYELEAEPFKSHWSPDFRFTAGDLEWYRPLGVTATVHVMRGDGAMARMQMFNGGEGVLLPSEGYADGEEIDLPLELQFTGTLTSDERLLDHDDYPDVRLSVFLDLREERESDDDMSAPLVYCWQEGSTQERWQWQRSRRLDIHDGRFNYDFDENVPDTTLTVDAGWGDKASLPTRLRVLLDTLAWA